MNTPIWEKVKLSSIISCLESGKRPKGGVSKYDEGIPSLGGEHLSSDGGFNFKKIRYVPNDYADKMTKGKVEMDDILLVKDGATTGKVSLVKKDFPYKKAVINEHLFSIRLPDNINTKWIFYQLFSELGKSQILKDFKGAPGGITTKFPDYVDISLPPTLSDQNNLVSFAEEFLTNLDATKKSLVVSKNLIKKYKQSVLKAAFSGDLTSEWRKKQKKIIKGKDLLEQIYKIRNKKFDEFSKNTKNLNSKIKKLKKLVLSDYNFLQPLPKEWSWEKLGFMTCGVEYGTSEKSKTKGKYPVIRMGNIQNNNIDWSDLVYTDTKEDIEKFELQKGDVLFNRTNSPELVGKSAIFKSDKKAIFAGYLIRINQITDIVDPNYLNYFLNSIIAKRHGSEVKTDGVNQSNINGNKLINYPFPYCSLEEQTEIVKIIEENFNNIEQLMKIIDRSLLDINVLRECMFRKLFRGEIKI